MDERQAIPEGLADMPPEPGLAATDTVLRAVLCDGRLFMPGRQRLG